jgi:hypothetical protein
MVADVQVLTLWCAVLVMLCCVVCFQNLAEAEQQRWRCDAVPAVASANKGS